MNYYHHVLLGKFILAWWTYGINGSSIYTAYTDECFIYSVNIMVIISTTIVSEFYVTHFFFFSDSYLNKYHIFFKWILNNCILHGANTDTGAWAERRPQSGSLVCKFRFLFKLFSLQMLPALQHSPNREDSVCFPHLSKCFCCKKLWAVFLECLHLFHYYS